MQAWGWMLVALAGCLPDTSGFSYVDDVAQPPDGGRADMGTSDMGNARDQGTAVDAGAADLGPADVDGGGPCTETWNLSDLSTRGFVVSFAHAADAAGGDHIVYTGDGGVEYMHRPLGGAWSEETVEPGAPGALNSHVAIATDSMGVPHVVFETYAGDIIHAVRTATGWEQTSVGNGSSAAIALTADDSVHVFFDGNGLSHATQTSESWSVDRIMRSDDGFTRAARADTIVVVPFGEDLHVVFTDFAAVELSHATRDADTWVLATIHPARVLPDGFDAAADRDGGLHVSFSDDLGNDLHYAHRPPGGPWETPIVVHDDVQRMGHPNAIAVSPGGDVHIAYRDEYSRDLRWATRPNGGAFRHELLDPDNGFAKGALADAGRIRFVYRAVPADERDLLRIAERVFCP